MGGGPRLLATRCRSWSTIAAGSLGQYVRTLRNVHLCTCTSLVPLELRHALWQLAGVDMVRTETFHYRARQGSGPAAFCSVWA